MMLGIAAAADPLPRRPEFNHYQAMASQSPFGIATVVPDAMPKAATDLYVASVACSEGDAVVTLGSATDKNFKEVISAKEPKGRGWRIQFRDIDCGDEKK